MARAPDPGETDAAHWAAVEEATELLEEGRLPEALLALRDVIKASPMNPYAYFFLGQARFEVGELARATRTARPCSSRRGSRVCRRQGKKGPFRHAEKGPPGGQQESGM